MKACRLFLIVLVIASKPYRAAASEPRVRDIAIEDASGSALQSFHAALRRAKQGGRSAVVIEYGSSTTAAGQFTGTLRDELRKVLAHGGGPGFLMPVRPTARYRHQDAHVESSEGWRCARVRKRDSRSVVGLAGYECESNSAQAWSRILVDRTKWSRFDTVELSYLLRPAGGHIDVFVDKAHTAHLDSDWKRPRLGLATLQVPLGSHTIELRPSGDGPIGVLGLVLQRRSAGLVVDTLGINGATAEILLGWHRDLWTSLVRAREPDLIIIAYGNEPAYSSSWLDGYGPRLERVVRQIRAAAPTASCLIRSPTDQAPPGPDAQRERRQRMRRLLRLQRHVASRFGCAFWDAQAAMGGPGSMLGWLDAGLASDDGVHLAPAAAKQLARAFASALLK